MSLRDRRTQLLLAGVVAAIGIVAAILLLGGEDDSESLDAALAYFPADAPVVISLETDLSDDQWEGFANTAGSGLLEQFGAGEIGGDSSGPLPSIGGLGGVEATVSAALLAQGINYEGEVKPVLGGQLVVGSTAPPADTADNPISGDEDAIWALETGDSEKAEKLLVELEDLRPVGEYEGAKLFGSRFGGTGQAGGREASIAIDGDVVLAGGDQALRAAIDRADGEDHLTVEDFEAALEGTPEDALLRVRVDPASYLALPDLAPLKQLPWVAALRSLGASASFEGSDANLEGIADTDPQGLTESDLPLSPETGEPALVHREGEVASGSLDQSYTTAFLLRAARAVFADSAFVSDVAAIEAELGIDFEQAVLRQFAGPSASSVTFDGRFAARSTVADPEAMRTLLPKLAPKLPQIVRDLDALGTEGLLALLFIAPDAPVSTTPSGAEKVAPLAGSPEGKELLYVIQAPRGPRGRIPAIALPERIIFGMVGDTFVVASDLTRAHEIAAAELAPVDGLSGASVLDAESLGDVPSRIGAFLGLDVTSVTSARGSIEASLERIEATLTASYD